MARVMCIVWLKCGVRKRDVVNLRVCLDVGCG